MNRFNMCIIMNKNIIPIISIIISIVAICISMPRVHNLGIDYLGFIVAIISIATTFAVGFQIWNAISFEQKLNKIKEETQKNAQDKIIKNNGILIHVIAYFGVYMDAKYAIQRKEFNVALNNYVAALEYLDYLKDYKIELDRSDIYRMIISIVNNYDFILTKEETENIILGITKTQNMELINLIPTIQSKSTQ